MDDILSIIRESAGEGCETAISFLSFFGRW
jgi:hypothetical protein